MAMAAEILGDRWTLLILREAFYGVRRYDDMRADLDAPRSMLTDRLNKLVARGLLARQPYQEPGSRARDAYVLTDAGRALALTLLALAQWGEDHVLHGPAPVQVVDRASGKPLRVALVDEQGRPADLAAAILVKRQDR
ncbi:MAG: helix-turn-helix domain-containing protein [Sphingomonadales bacterium]